MTIKLLGVNIENIDLQVQQKYPSDRTRA